VRDPRRLHRLALDKHGLGLHRVLAEPLKSETLPASE
jgi:hypothetical protein